MWWGSGSGSDSDQPAASVYLALPEITEPQSFWFPRHARDGNIHCMLSILEKLQYSLSVLVIIASLGIYFSQGMARPPSQILRPMQPVKAPVRPSAPAKTVAGSGAAAASKEDQDILQRLLKEKNLPVAGRELVHDDRKVPKDRLEYMSREANWQPELDKAKHQLLPGADGRMTRLKVYDIDEESLIKQSGIENGDVIEFIDGKSLDFEKTSAVDYIQHWKQFKEKIQKGGKLTLTITRKGEPIQKSFQLE